MRQNAHEGPIHRLVQVWEARAVFDHTHHKLVDQMRMAAAVAAALNEAQVDILTHVIDALRRERTNGLRQQVGIIRNLYLFHRLTTEVQHRVIVLGELPLEGRLGAVAVEALLILACRIEQVPSDLTGHILAADLELGRLKGER